MLPWISSTLNLLISLEMATWVLVMKCLIEFHFVQRTKSRNSYKAISVITMMKAHSNLYHPTDASCCYEPTWWCNSYRRCRKASLYDCQTSWLLVTAPKCTLQTCWESGSIHWVPLPWPSLHGQREDSKTLPWELFQVNSHPWLHSSVASTSSWWWNWKGVTPIMSSLLNPIRWWSLQYRRSDLTLSYFLGYNYTISRWWNETLESIIPSSLYMEFC